MSIKTDPEFKDLIPPLSSDEYMMLEQSCVEEGIRDALVVWEMPNGDCVLIDGHNRFEISAKHAGIPFEVKKKHFNLREDAKDWIIRNQLGRRNINDFVRIELALQMEKPFADEAKTNSLANLKNADVQKFAARGRVRDRLGELAGVSGEQIRKVKVIQEKAPEETKQALRHGEVSINSVYSGIKAGENETKKQKESRELRDAKKRNEEFREQRNNPVVDFQELAQNKKDVRKIYEEFETEISQAGRKMGYFHNLIREEKIEEILKGGSKEELDRLKIQLSSWRDTIFQIMIAIEEV